MTGEDAPMIARAQTASGRSGRDLALVREARRVVGLERSYTCAECGHRHTSWARLHECPECGERLAIAVIRRAAFA